MDGKQALYYAAIALAVLIGVGAVVSVVLTIVSVLSTLITAAVALAVLAGLGYAGYKAGSWLLGGDDASSLDSVGGAAGSSTATDTAESRQDRLRRQYVEGQISEAEFERRIADELETEDVDEIDRELERER
jgi:nucleosome binding factor SPN SPT16 subunit